MVRSDADDDCASIAGDGDYAIEVVSESRHQDRLEWLAQGRGEEPADYSCTALLVHEPDNPYDDDAVSVSINSVRIGYLPSDAAAAMVAAMDAWGFRRATCEAIVEGGWYRSADDKGDFCVRLDINPDFVPATLPVAHRPPPLPAPIPVAVRARNTAYDLLLGAAATVAMLVLVGVVWVFVQQTAESVTNDRPAVAASMQAPETGQWRGPGPASRRLAREQGEVTTQPNGARVLEIGAASSSASHRGSKVFSATPDQPLLVPTPAESRRLRPLVAVTETTADASALPAPQLATALLPESRDITVGDRARVTSADVGEVRHLRTPTGLSVERQPSVAALVSPVADEVRLVPGRGPLLATVAQGIAKEIDSQAAAVMPPPGLRPVPQLAAYSALPPESAPGTEWVNVIPPPRPEVDTADSEPKTAPDVRRSRAHARSQAALRAARARARARNAARYRRSERRAVQYRRAVSRAPAATRPVVAAPPLPPAMRMFEAWTREVTGVVERPRPQP